MKAHRMKAYSAIRVLAALFVVLGLMVSAGFAQKKSYTFRGKVEKVTDNNLTVNGEKVEGWMEAMTMAYKVDKPEVLKTLKPGDQITATVYDGDLTLHNIQKAAAQQKSKK
jgi:Cu/Ag efflux protein CusF